MKILFSLFFLFIPTFVTASEENFICSDIDFGGFYYDGSKYKLTLFNLETFEIKVDFINRSFESEELGIIKGDLSEVTCLDNSINLAYLNCTNRYGQTFMMNTQNYEFTYSHIFGHVGDGPSVDNYADSIGVRFGTCKKI